MDSYVICLYERELYDGINEEFSLEENDVLVKFLHCSSHAVLRWPAIEVRCWVPANHGLQLLSISTVNTSGYPFTFLKREFKDTQ